MTEEEKEKTRETENEPTAPLESIEHLQEGALEPGVERPPGKVYETQYGPGQTTDPQLAAEQGLSYSPPHEHVIQPSDAPQRVEIAAGFDTAEGRPGPEADTLPREVVLDDLELRERIYQALRTDEGTAHLTDIAVGVVSGIVYLRGQVHEQREMDRALAIARQVARPLEVRNHIEIQ